MWPPASPSSYTVTSLLLLWHACCRQARFACEMRGKMWWKLGHISWVEIGKKLGTVLLVKNVWLMMSCSEGHSWGLGVRIHCTSLLTLRDTSLPMWCELVLVVVGGSAQDLRSSSLMRLRTVNLLIHFFDILSLEGWPTNNEGIEDDTDWPGVLDVPDWQYVDRNNGDGKCVGHCRL